MTSLIRHRDRPDRWTLPRQPMHASERLMRHGPIVPMDYREPGLLARVFGALKREGR